MASETPAHNFHYLPVKGEGNTLKINVEGSSYKKLSYSRSFQEDSLYQGSLSQPSFLNLITEPVALLELVGILITLVFIARLSLIKLSQTEDNFSNESPDPKGGNRNSLKNFLDTAFTGAVLSPKNFTGDRLIEASIGSPETGRRNQQESPIGPRVGQIIFADFSRSSSSRSFMKSLDREGVSRSCITRNSATRNQANRSGLNIDSLGCYNTGSTFSKYNRVSSTAASLKGQAVAINQ